MERRQLLERFAQLGAFAIIAPRFPFAQDDRSRFVAPKLDAHAHLLSRELASWIHSTSADSDVRRTVRPINGRIVVDSLEQDRIERAIVLSTACLHAAEGNVIGRRKRPADEYQDVQNENDFTLAEAVEYAPKLIPFASVNPKRDYAVDELRRCVGRKMLGLNVHFGGSDVRLRDPRHLERVQTLFAEAAKLDVPIIAHVFNEAIPDFGTEDIEILVTKIVEPLPALRISIAHLGGSGGASEQGPLRIFAALIQAVRARPQIAPQIWADCSSVLLTEARPGAKPISTAQRAALGGMLRSWGLDRLMWGSDTISDRQPTALEQARTTWPLADEEWRTLAGFNGTGFLRQSGT
ncbi:MAG TPA: amidohydrolase family protein [Vicinamibacterales bacterium]|nr:amidohydrolase family protein [Vicinamibacterales bacterium]